MDKLEEIMAWKKREIADQLRPVRSQEFARLASIRQKGPTFREALADPGHLSLIAEIKRRSPSAGDIAGGAAAQERARLYYNAGVDAVSVLTDEKYFSGSLRDLWEVSEFLQLREDAPPVLRKDFMIHPIQILEAAEAGAGAILIIVRALSDDEISELYEAANLAGLDSLFEIHEEEELDRALQAGAKIIGVNNRNLTNFTTDLGISEKLLPLVPDEIVKVSESGIFELEDAWRAREAGADAVLVGQALMELDDPEPLIKELRNLP